MTDPRAQGSYQVRFDWGAAGAAAIAQDADACVWVDELGDPAPPAAPVETVTGRLADAEALAGWCLSRQEAHGGRFRIAVVAAGETEPDGSLRFAVEDFLAAGAIIEAIAGRGIDHQSPEAAAAAAAYVGLRNATAHLVSASVTARRLRAAST